MRDHLYAGSGRRSRLTCDAADLPFCWADHSALKLAMPATFGGMTTDPGEIEAALSGMNETDSMVGVGFFVRHPDRL